MSALGVVLALSLALAPAVSSETVGAVAPCRFATSRLEVAPTFLASDELTPHVRLMIQPDSPVAIVRADLRGMSLTIGDRSYSTSGHYSIDVQNVSDRTIAGVTVRIAIQRSDRSGVGSRTTLSTRLRPGELGTLKGRFGRGESSSAQDTSDPLVYVLVDSVDFDDCTYEPAKQWPKAELPRDDRPRQH